ncbi:MAG: mannose-6-phosphate isomerase, class I [Nitriliruptoraceae bacterium]
MSADVHAAGVAAGPMRPAVRHYPWGSHTALAALRGDGPSALPEAEWWYGAHPLGSAMLDVDGRASALDELIARDPDGHLGTGLVERFGPVLPFLVKLLAADEPLSLQVHPSAARAARGFADEEARGMPRDAPERRYRDTWPKPELLHALGTFDALCGMRDPDDAIDLLGHLSLDLLDGIADRLVADGRDAWPGIVRDLLRVESSEARRLVDRVVADLDRVRAPRPDDADALDAVAGIARDHPGDPAVVVALFMEHHRLEVGDELVTPPGVPHLYLRGCGVEVMATSDNVLRGGMTTKHVDVDEFVAVLDPGARHRVTRAATSIPAKTTDPEDAGSPEHFQLAAVASGDAGGVELDRRGPQILLCTAGRVEVRVDDQTWTIGATEAIYAPAAAMSVHVQGDGRLHRVTVGVAPGD